MNILHSRYIYIILVAGIAAVVGYLIRPLMAQTDAVPFELLLHGDAIDAPSPDQPLGLLLQPEVYIIQDQPTLDAFWRDYLKLAPDRSRINSPVSPPLIDFTRKTAIIIVDVPQTRAERTLAVRSLTRSLPYLRLDLSRDIRCASLAASSRPYHVLVIEKTAANFLVDIQSEPFDCTQ